MWAIVESRYKRYQLQRRFQEQIFCHTKMEIFFKSSSCAEQSDCFFWSANEIGPIRLFVLITFRTFRMTGACLLQKLYLRCLVESHASKIWPTTDLVKAVDVGGDNGVDHLLPPGQPRQDEPAVEVHLLVLLDLWVGFWVAGAPRGEGTLLFVHCLI